MKTTAAHFEALREAVVKDHPYEVPEVIELPIERGHAPYLEWIEASVGGV
jgi:periplasmic divalent cation tolerance protein